MYISRIKYSIYVYTLSTKVIIPLWTRNVEILLACDAVSYSTGQKSSNN